MFAALESSLKTLLTDAIPGAPVFGTFDVVDFAATGAPGVAIRVDWGGFGKRGQKDDAMLGDQRFDVSIIVNAIRVSSTVRDAAVAGITTVLQRLIAWRPGDDKQALIEPGAPGDGPGGLWAYPITLTISDTVIRVS